MKSELVAPENFENRYFRGLEFEKNIRDQIEI